MARRRHSNRGTGRRVCRLAATLLVVGAGRAPADDAALGDRWERPGVIADRRERVVRVEARATGLDRTVQTEFILIGPKSGHDYEAAAVSKATPGDVHAALEFIGLRPGRPYNPSQLSFWARGPRVEVFVEWDETTPEGGTIRRRVRAEEAIVDRRTGRTLPPLGFVFSGSIRVPDDDGDEAYAPDVRDPMSILPAYNETISVLDIPRQGVKEELYEHQYMNGDLGWRAGQTLVFEFRPVSREGLPLEWDVFVHFRPAPSGEVVMQVRIDGTDVATSASLREVLDELRRRRGQDARLFATFSFADDLSLAQLSRAAAHVQEMSDGELVCVEPPPPGQLFYRAFLPNPAFRERHRRPAQPWELYLRAGPDGRAQGELVRVTRRRTPATDSEFDEERFPLESPEKLVLELERLGPGLSVILVFAPSTMTHGELRRFIGPALKTHPVVYFFTHDER